MFHDGGKKKKKGRWKRIQGKGGWEQVAPTSRGRIVGHVPGFHTAEQMQTSGHRGRKRDLPC